MPAACTPARLSGASEQVADLMVSSDVVKETAGAVPVLHAWLSTPLAGSKHEQHGGSVSEDYPSYKVTRDC